jgi:hypothetical protein
VHIISKTSFLQTNITKKSDFVSIHFFGFKFVFLFNDKLTVMTVPPPTGPSEGEIEVIIGMETCFSSFSFLKEKIQMRDKTHKHTE